MRARVFLHTLAFVGAGLVVWLCAFTVSRAQQAPAREKVGGRDAAPGRVLIKLRSSATAADSSGLAALADADSNTPVGDGRVRVLHSRTRHVAELIDMLSRLPQVQYVEPDYVLHAQETPNDPAFPAQWGLNNTGQTVNGTTGTPGADVHAIAAWDLARGSSNTVIGIIDGGFDYTHVDLAANVWSAPAAFTVTIGGHAVTCPAGTHGGIFFEGLQLQCDPTYSGAAQHATHVAGIAGATGNNGFGIAGAAWRTSMMSLNFMLDGETGYDSDAIDAIEFAIQVQRIFAGSPAGNVRVLNASWGGSGFSQALQDEIDRAGANDMLFVSAAGNSRANLDESPEYPPAFNRPTQLTVAASASDDSLAPFSNYSTTSVHIAAPGTNIWSTLPGGLYGYMSGTSMAAPLVSGAAALLLSRCQLTVTDLRALILNTVDLRASFANTVSSGGRLNMAAALQACASDAPLAAPAVTLSAPLDGSVYLEGTPIELEANASDTDGSIARVDFYSGSTPLGTAMRMPYAFDWSGAASGTYALTAVATDDGGLQTRSDAVFVTIAASGATTGSLPAPWREQDVGDVGISGQGSYSGGVFSVQGGGRGAGGATDSFAFVYQPLITDGEIDARVRSAPNTSSAAQTGIVLRDDLGEGSPEAFLGVRPDGTVEFLTRANSGLTVSTVKTWAAGVPVWLKLARRGLVAYGYASTDGLNWMPLGVAFFNNTPAYGGLVVSSGSTAQVQASAFDHVAVVGGTPPSVTRDNGSSDVIVYAGDVPPDARHGAWSLVSDSTAAAGVKLASPDDGTANTDAPLASPTDYVDVTFAANAGIPYTFWMRMEALGNSKYNDSVWVQFSDAVSGSTPVYPLNSAQGLLVNLATDSTGSGLNGWGWQNTAYWLSQTTTITFATSGVHTLRIQTREDGVAWDQVVLSPAVFLHAPPGSVTSDRTIVAKPGSQLPGAPAVPSPADGATGVSTTPTLTWTANGATNYDVFFDTSPPETLVVYNQTAASYSPPPLAPSTRYFWQVIAHNSAGATAGTFWSFTTGGGLATLPSPWVSADVGVTGRAGTATFADNTFTVSGAGADIWGRSDGFQYVNRPLSGDVAIIARIATEQNTDTFAKAGIMLRESLADDAANVTLDMRPAGDFELMTRPSDGAPEAFIATANLPRPAWLRLARSGSTVTGSVSADGVNWTDLGTATLASRAILGGLVVCSHTTSLADTATFDNVLVESGTGLPSPWTSQDVGAVGRAGAASFANGVFSVAGAGADIWGASDGFQYVSQSGGGDVSITARITSLQDTSSFAKVGVMLRDSNAADAAHVLLDIRPTGDFELMTRASDGADEQFIATAHLPLPAWVRLARSGSQVTGSVSPDGSHWITLGSAVLAQPNVLSGLIVCSHTTTATSTATFDNVSVVTAGP